jgi:thiopurine S-methyltransferase
MRKRYTSHLMDITDAAIHCLICFEYDQSKLEGPPFSIPEDELLAHYAAHYQLEPLTRVDVEGGLKGQCPALEVVWYLAPHST